MQNDPADLATLLVFLLATITSREIATISGPYIAIFLLACAGAGLALMSSEVVMGPMKSLWFVTARVLAAVTLTVGAAKLVAAIIPALQAQWTFIPIAFGIGFISDYAAVRKWIGEKISRYTNVKIGGTPDDTK